MLLIPSAQAMSPPPLHQSDGISTEARYRGVGVARGYGGYRHYGYGHRRYGYSGYRRYGYGGYGRYGYRGYGYRAYRPYGYGVARGIARVCAGTGSEVPTRT